MKEPLQVLSLGAGVQSSCMALMSAMGELPPVDVAIFADTGAEPQRVYDYLEWLEDALPFPVHRVMWKDGLYENIKESIKGARFAGAPFFTESPTGKAEGMLRRQCTREFKIQPIIRKVRELVGLEYRQRAPKGEILVNQWIGISMDEIIRMKYAREKWILNIFPLIDKKMTRWHCLDWMQKRGYPRPEKSSCTFCPYHDDNFWRDMKDNDPQAFSQAVEVDEMIRGGVRGTKQKIYVHRSLTPLADADLTTPESAGQMSMLDECDGMCGV